MTVQEQAIRVLVRGTKKYPEFSLRTLLSPGYTFYDYIEDLEIIGDVAYNKKKGYCFVENQHKCHLCGK